MVLSGCQGSPKPLIFWEGSKGWLQDLTSSLLLLNKGKLLPFASEWPGLSVFEGCVRSAPISTQVTLLSVPSLPVPESEPCTPHLSCYSGRFNLLSVKEPKETL